MSIFWGKSTFNNLSQSIKAILCNYLNPALAGHQTETTGISFIHKNSYTNCHVETYICTVMKCKSHGVLRILDEISVLCQRFIPKVSKFVQSISTKQWKWVFHLLNNNLLFWHSCTWTYMQQITYSGWITRCFHPTFVHAHSWAIH